MISSMTGYGRGEAARGGISAVAEIRSVNNRFLEVAARLPRSLSLRENEVKELIRKKINRGKVNVTLTIERDNGSDIPLKVNATAARASYKLLNDLRKAVKLRDKVTLDQVLKFSEVLEPKDIEEGDSKEWSVAEQALVSAIDQLADMRIREGGELKRDLEKRVALMSTWISDVETMSQHRIPEERQKLHDRIAQLISDSKVVNEERLELEIVLLADRLDVTEECVRFRSHVKFFIEAYDAPEASGRKLGFLLQEMNREANTIGSKSSDAAIAHKVVAIKEELEKVREQLQNIE